MSRMAHSFLSLFAFFCYGISLAAAEPPALLAGVGPVEEPVEGGVLTHFNQVIIPFRGAHHQVHFRPYTAWFDSAMAEHIDFLCRRHHPENGQVASLDFPDGWNISSEDSLWLYSGGERHLVTMDDRPRLVFDQGGCRLLHASIESSESWRANYGLITTLEGEIYSPLDMAQPRDRALLPPAARDWLAADASYTHGCQPGRAWHARQAGLEWLVTRYCDHPVDGQSLEVVGIADAHAEPKVLVLPRPKTGSNHIDGVFDLDLDGRIEIALHFREAGVTEFHILEWNGKEFLPFEMPAPVP